MKFIPYDLCSIVDTPRVREQCPYRLAANGAQDSTWPIHLLDL